MPSTLLAAIETHSEDETIAFGARIAPQLARGVTLLIGNLGAGKTTLVKGIALGVGAGAPEEISSPTFTLIHEYGNPASIYHIDLYRLDSLRQVETLGLDELFERDALILIEWGERFPQILPARRNEIHIIRTGDESRRISVYSVQG